MLAAATIRLNSAIASSWDRSSGRAWTPGQVAGTGLCGGRGSYTYPQHELVADGLRRARLDLIVSDPLFSRWFAQAYAGVDD